MAAQRQGALSPAFAMAALKAPHGRPAEGGNGAVGLAIRSVLLMGARRPREAGGAARVRVGQTSRAVIL